MWTVPPPTQQAIQPSALRSGAPSPRETMCGSRDGSGTKKSRRQTASSSWKKLAAVRCGPRSSTSTRSPARASDQAAAPPPAPDPTTQASNASVAMAAAGPAQVRLGKADGAPSDLAVVPAVDGVGEEAFQRQGVEAAEQRLLGKSPHGNLAARELAEHGVLVCRAEHRESLAVGLLRPEVQQARELLESRAQRGEAALELARDEAAYLRLARARSVVGGQDARRRRFEDCHGVRRRAS